MDQDQKQDDDVLVIMCSTLEEMPVPGHPDAKINICATCGRNVWMAPSSYELLEQAADKGLESRVSCNDCFFEETTTNPEAEAVLASGKVMIAPQAVQEAIDLLGKDVVDKAMAELGMTVRGLDEE